MALFENVIQTLSEGLHGEMELNLFPVTMTDGGDVMFPGSGATIPIQDRDSLLQVMEKEPPLLGHVVVDAWGQRSDVGTASVLMFSSIPGPKETASAGLFGIQRFRILEVYENDGPLRARVQLFSDEVESDRKEELERLEKELLGAIREHNRLRAKLSDGSSAAEGGGQDASQLNIRSDIGLRSNDPNRTSELVGFIGCELLDLPFIERKILLESTDTRERLERAIESFHPLVQELAAKAAIQDAMG